MEKAAKATFSCYSCKAFFCEAASGLLLFQRIANFGFFASLRRLLIRASNTICALFWVIPCTIAFSDLPALNLVSLHPAPAEPHYLAYRSPYRSSVCLFAGSGSANAAWLIGSRPERLKVFGSPNFRPAACIASAPLPAFRSTSSFSAYPFRLLFSFVVLNQCLNLFLNICQRFHRFRFVLADAQHECAVAVYGDDVRVDARRAVFTYQTAVKDSVGNRLKNLNSSGRLSLLNQPV